jgi:hypothetical protein
LQAFADPHVQLVAARGVVGGDLMQVGAKGARD